MHACECQENLLGSFVDIHIDIYARYIRVLNPHVRTIYMRIRIHVHNTHPQTHRHTYVLIPTLATHRSILTHSHTPILTRIHSHIRIHSYPGAFAPERLGQLFDLQTVIIRIQTVALNRNCRCQIAWRIGRRRGASAWVHPPGVGGGFVLADVATQRCGRRRDRRAARKRGCGFRCCSCSRGWRWS